LVRERGISTSAIIGIVVVILVIAIAGAYLATRGGGAPATTTASPSTTTTAPATTTTTTTTVAPPKGTLIVAMGTDASTLDPQDATDNPSEMVNRIIYEGLVEFDQNLNIKPMLAESWDIKDNGTTYVFHLRKGVFFQDGTPFDAYAVKTNFDRVLNSTLKLQRYSLYAPIISSVEVIDNYTVAFHLKMPFGAFLNDLAHGAGLIISPTLINSGKDVKINPVGTGPYMLQEWVKGDHITLVANPNYWNKTAAPKFEKIIIKVVADDKARENLLKTGDVDLVLRIPPVDVASLNGTGNIITRAYPTSRVIYIAMNLMNQKFQDVRVRQAFNYAVDKEAIINSILNGLGKPATSPLASSTYGYCYAGYYKYNVTLAKELLKEAGWWDRDGDGYVENANGQKLEVNLWTPQGRYVGDYQMAQAVQSYLNAIGVKVNLQVWEWTSYLNEVRKPYNQSQNKELFLMGWAPSTGEGDWVLRPLLASWMWAPAGSNYGYYNNTQVDELIQKQMMTLGQDRLNAMCQAQKIVYNDAPWIFMVEMYDTLGMKSNVKGVVYLPIEIVMLKYAYSG
jgi:peptide/nickel transport system substrate-binding protein/glutathione transport system substrate-binding protein